MSNRDLFPKDLLDAATALIDACQQARLKLVTAESCTGGLIAAVLTEVPGASHVFDRGFVTYSNEAKVESLGVPAELVEQHGAVSREVAQAMAEGALAHSQADIAISVTGIAGPGGGTASKPVGSVHIAVHRRGRLTRHHEYRFGDIGRSAVRMATLREALGLLDQLISKD